MNAVRYVQAVLWSFIGLGRRRDMAELVRGANPLALIAVGFTMAGLFVATLLGLALFAVHAAT